jgi:hypothetical protein
MDCLVAGTTLKRHIVRINPSHILLLILAALLGQSCVPYSLDHFKHIKANTLRSNVKEWMMKGKPGTFGYTNSTEKCWLVSTNIVIPNAGATPLPVVMALDSTVFRARGCLFATEHGAVFWLEGDKIELITAPK